MNSIIENEIDDKIPVSKKIINDCGLDIATLKKRDYQIIELKKMYPNMSESMIELAWNWCQTVDLEEQDRIIASGELDKPSSRNGLGGILHDGVHIEKSQSTLDYEKSILDV
jgi:hypothetical protein